MVLKDRDLSGELKNIWGAVQAKRETEREQVMPGKNPDLVVYTELGPDTAVTPRQENGQETVGDSQSVVVPSSTNAGEPDGVSATANSPTPAPEVVVLDQNLACNGDSRNNKDAVSDRINGDAGERVVGQAEHRVPEDTIDNVPQGNTEPAQEAEPKGLSTQGTAVVAPAPSPQPPPESLPKVAPVPNGVVAPVAKANGKAEKEVANVNEKKKEKSISGFLHSGFFGKRNKDKDPGAVKEKSSKPKLGSFKSKLLMGAGRGEKEDKGSEANVKKLLRSSRGSGEEANTQFSEIGQSMTTAK